MRNRNHIRSGQAQRQSRQARARSGGCRSGLDASNKITLESPRSEPGRMDIALVEVMNRLCWRWCMSCAAEVRAISAPCIEPEGNCEAACKSKTDWKRVKREAEAEAPVPYDPTVAPYDPNDPKAVEAYWKQAKVRRARGPQKAPQGSHGNSPVARGGEFFKADGLADARRRAQEYARRTGRIKSVRADGVCSGSWPNHRRRRAASSPRYWRRNAARRRSLGSCEVCPLAQTRLAVRKAATAMPSRPPEGVWLTSAHVADEGVVHQRFGVDLRHVAGIALSSPSPPFSCRRDGCRRAWVRSSSGGVSP